MTKLRRPPTASISMTVAQVGERAAHASESPTSLPEPVAPAVPGPRRELAVADQTGQWRRHQRLDDVVDRSVVASISRAAGGPSRSLSTRGRRRSAPVRRRLSKVVRLGAGSDPAQHQFAEARSAARRCRNCRRAPWLEMNSRRRSASARRRRPGTHAIGSPRQHRTRRRAAPSNRVRRCRRPGSRAARAHEGPSICPSPTCLSPGSCAHVGP